MSTLTPRAVPFVLCVDTLFAKPCIDFSVIGVIILVEVDCMRTFVPYIITIVLLLASGEARAGVNSNASLAMPILNVGVGARAAGMGDSFTAVADDVTAIFWNSAGLADLESSELTFAHNSWIQDSNSENIGYAHPLGRYGTIGGGFAYTGYGSFERRDEFGALLSGKTSSYDLGIVAAYGIGPFAGHCGGAAVKYYYQSIFGEGSSAIALDLGGITHLGSLLSFGVNARNIGVLMTSSDMSFDLPMGLRVGAALHPTIGDNHKLIFAIDTDARLENFDRFNLGLEYSIARTAAVRCGYVVKRYDNDLDGLSNLSLGLGGLYKGVKMDYAFSANGDLGAAHRISLTMRLGEWIGKKQPAPGPTAQEGAMPAELPTESAGESQQAATTIDNRALAHKKYKEGLALQRQDDQRAAFAAYYESVHLDANNADVWLKLGNIYYKFNKKNEAVKCYEASLNLNPANEELRRWLEQYRNLNQ